MHVSRWPDGMMRRGIVRNNSENKRCKVICLPLFRGRAEVILSFPVLTHPSAQSAARPWLGPRRYLRSRRTLFEIRDQSGLPSVVYIFRSARAPHGHFRLSFILKSSSVAR